MHGLLGYLGVSTCRVLHGLVQGQHSQLSVGVEERPGFQCDHFCGVNIVPPRNTAPWGLGLLTLHTVENLRITF